MIRMELERKKLKMSRKDLAYATGISEHAILNMENNGTTPKLGMWKPLGEFFGMTIEKLFEEIR